MKWVVIYFVICTIVSTISESDLDINNVTAANCNGEYESAIELNKQNRLMKLICRDDTTLVIAIKNHCWETEVITEKQEIYKISVHQKDAHDYRRRPILTNQSIARIEDLKPNTKYAISATFLDEYYQYLAKEYFMEFQTLPMDYIPIIVESISTNNFSLSESGNGLDVEVLWYPSADRTCAYKLYVCDQNDCSEYIILQQMNSSEELYRHHLKDLKFETNYGIVILPSKLKTEILHQRQQLNRYDYIATPSCLEWSKNDLSLCAPYKPNNIIVEAYHVTQSRYILEISWDSPPQHPDYYTVHITEWESDLRYIDTINGRVNLIQTDVMEIIGLDFELIITAHSLGGKTSSIFVGNIYQPKIYQPSVDESYTLQIIIGFIMSLVFIVLVSMKLACNICENHKNTAEFEEVKLEKQ